MKTFAILIGGGKRPSGRPRNRRKDNIKAVLKCDIMVWVGFN
jgi:hypothetical protein